MPFHGFANLSTGDPLNQRQNQIRVAALTALFIGTTLSQVSGQIPTGVPPIELPPPIPAWAKEFESFKGSPRPIAYLVSQRTFQTGTFLVGGVRPKEDRPTAGLPIFGPPLKPGDWMLEDSSGAIRIFGVPPPEPGRRAILAAQFTVGDALPSLKVLRMMASGRGDGTDAIRVGEYLHLPIPSSKSTSLYPEFSGNTTSIEALFLHEGVILRGVAPGTVTIKVFEQRWNRATPEFVKEFKLKVRN